MSAAFILAAAGAIDETGSDWTPAEVKKHLEHLADGLDPAPIVDQQAVSRIPLTGPHLAEAIGRHLFRADRVESDYARCVQVAQLLGDCANRLDTVGDHSRADLLREYAHGISLAGNAL